MDENTSANYSIYKMQVSHTRAFVSLEHPQPSQP